MTTAMDTANPGGKATIRDNLAERIDYGRSIRARADCLIEAHGALAEGEALKGAREPGISEAERLFWEAVAARVARQLHPAAKRGPLRG